MCANIFPGKFASRETGFHIWNGDTIDGFDRDGQRCKWTEYR